MQGPKPRNLPCVTSHGLCPVLWYCIIPWCWFTTCHCKRIKQNQLPHWKNTHTERGRALAGSQRLWSSDKKQMFGFLSEVHTAWRSPSGAVWHFPAQSHTPAVRFLICGFVNHLCCLPAFHSNTSSLSPLFWSSKIHLLNFSQCFHLLKEELFLLWVEDGGRLESGRSCLSPS